MNLLALYIVAGFMVVGIIGTFIYLLVLRFRERQEPEDNPQFLNFMPQYAKGHNKGIIDKIIQGDKRVGIRFFPRDLNYVKLLKENKKVKIEPITIFFKKELVFPFAKDWSSHRNDIIGLPPTAEDFPESIKRNPIGQALMQAVEGTNKKIEERDLLRSRVKHQSEILQKTEGLDIVEDFMDLEEEKDKQLIKIVKEEKKTGLPISTGHTIN